MICVNEMSVINKAMRQNKRTISEWLFNIRVALFRRLGRVLPPFLVPILNPPFC